MDLRDVTRHSSCNRMPWYCRLLIFNNNDNGNTVIVMMIQRMMTMIMILNFSICSAISLVLDIKWKANLQTYLKCRFFMLSFKQSYFRYGSECKWFKVLDQVGFVPDFDPVWPFFWTKILNKISIIFFLLYKNKYIEIIILYYNFNLDVLKRKSSILKRSWISKFRPDPTLSK